VSFGLGKLLAFRTTGTRLAVFLASKPCGTCYSVLSSLTPFQFCPESGQAFTALASDIQLLRFNLFSYIIQQKERLLNFRMNLYFRDIFYRAFFRSKKEILLPNRARGLT
jgi:hypothetical protein